MQGQEQTTMAVVPGGAPPSENSDMKSQMWNENKEKFLKGEPKVLGVVQVMIALINLSFGIIILANLSSEPLIYAVLMAPSWGPIMLIGSGSLAIAAGVKPTKSLIISRLTLNTITSALAATASIMGVVSVAVGSQVPIRDNYTITKGTDILMVMINMLEICNAEPSLLLDVKLAGVLQRGLVVLPSNPAVTGGGPPPGWTASTHWPPHQETPKGKKCSRRNVYKETTQKK
uniref:MS4A9 n=1 Tax=Mus musculus TaxID=10090 RepID=Q9EQY9_MOUSE|nr:MS4A9 [Mus musculus]